ncbi:MAG: nuclear transport factor 2 family protein [Bacteroidales bacterium]
MKVITHVKDPPLTGQEIYRITNEVKEASEYLMTGWAALDGETAIKSFSPEMVSCYEGRLLDYDAYRESWAIYTGAREDIRITPVEDDFIILTREFVIYSWVGRVEERIKSGESVEYNPIRYTNLFKKSDGEWWIIFAQSSGVPVIKSKK